MSRVAQVGAQFQSGIEDIAAFLTLFLRPGLHVSKTIVPVCFVDNVCADRPTLEAVRQAQQSVD